MNPWSWATEQILAEPRIAPEFKAGLIVNQCSCGHSYDAAAWAALPLHGYQEIPADDEGPACRLEMRHCSGCGSTRAIEVPIP